MDYPWYEFVSKNAPLEQGDLLFDCPVVEARSVDPCRSDADQTKASKMDAVDSLSSETSFLDVIVMTQACVLQNKKIPFVTLCPHYSLLDFREVWESLGKKKGSIATDRKWKDFLDSIRKERNHGFALLNNERIAETENSAEKRIVDFREVLSIPTDFLEMWIIAYCEQRYRLLPPYREHIAQSFARFFARVGLPKDIEIQEEDYKNTDRQDTSKTM